jgi:HSP20 family molecular chaperone IbpA
MFGRREFWEVSRFSGGRRGFRPQCDCHRTDDRPALHLVLELGEDVEADGTIATYDAGTLRVEVPLTPSR